MQRLITSITVLIYLCGICYGSALTNSNTFVARSELTRCLGDGATTPLCRDNQIHARLPPTINPNPKSFLSWKAPPAGWFYGTWSVTYTSQPTYLTFDNLQTDWSPAFPQSTLVPGQNNDLSSFQIPNSSAIETAYGIDTPRRSNNKSLGSEWDAVYDFVGTGNLAQINNSWELLAWGYDTCGDGYMVIYETPVAASGAPSDLDIDSRSDTGPTPETLTNIFQALRDLGNSEVSTLVAEIKPAIQNGARRGMNPVTCDAACVNNGPVP